MPASAAADAAASRNSRRSKVSLASMACFLLLMVPDLLVLCGPARPAGGRPLCCYRCSDRDPAPLARGDYAGIDHPHDLPAILEGRPDRAGAGDGFDQLADLDRFVL